MAVESLVSDFYASSSRHKQQTMWRTIKKVLDRWGLEAFPPTQESIVAVGAALKAGAFASAENYLTHYRVCCERAGSPYDAALNRLHLDVVRSCRRGAGGPTKALALPLLRLAELDLATDLPWIGGGPVGSACAMVAGAWFLTREVELSTTRAALVSLETSSEGDPLVRWHLPASKTDAEARGVARAHGCCCIDGVLASCPYHAISMQLDRLRRLFPSRWEGDAPDLDLPLFPALDGSTVTKDKMVSTIVEAAVRLQIPLAAPDGSARVSGHSLRVTGAQGLSRLGIDVWAIQLLGRWGSSAVLDYIREVPLELSASWARRAAQAVSLEEMLRSRSSAAGSSSTPSLTIARPSPLPSSAACLLQGTALEGALDEAERAACVQATPIEACKFVASPSGKWHRLSFVGLAGASAGWSAACGWRFAGSLASLATDLPPQLCHKFFCSRCFPEHRASLKGSA